VRTLFLAVLTILATACSDAVAPEPDPALDEAALLGFFGSLVSDPGSHYLGHLHRLPHALALTEAQRAQIQALLEQFAASTEADREALAKIGREAREAARTGKSREEVRAILARGATVRERLHAAEAKLRADVAQVLTAEQRAWLDGQERGRCTPVPLSEEQRIRISALVAAYQEANAADFAAVRAALAEARQAHRSGASREDIAQILEGVRPAMERIRAAGVALAADIEALLTPEQRASGCFRIHPTGVGG
jgi:Spy/CpxP family protein refolding chaperone